MDSEVRNGEAEKPEKRMIRVLIADDHLIVREGLRLIAEAAGDIDIVGEAKNGVEAVSLSRDAQTGCRSHGPPECRNERP